MTRQAEEFVAVWIQTHVDPDTPVRGNTWDSLSEQLLADARVEGIWPLEIAIALEAHPNFGFESGI